MALTFGNRGELLSLHWTWFNFLPVSISFIIFPQSGRFFGRDLNISSFCFFSGVNVVLTVGKKHSFHLVRNTTPFSFCISRMFHRNFYLKSSEKSAYGFIHNHKNPMYFNFTFIHWFSRLIKNCGDNKYSIIQKILFSVILSYNYYYC